MSLREVAAAILSVAAGLILLVVIVVLSFKSFDWSVEHSTPYNDLRATVQVMQTQIAGQR